MQIRKTLPPPFEAGQLRFGGLFVKREFQHGVCRFCQQSYPRFVPLARMDVCQRPPCQTQHRRDVIARRNTGRAA